MDSSAGFFVLTCFPSADRASPLLVIIVPFLIAALGLSRFSGKLLIFRRSFCPGKWWDLARAGLISSLTLMSWPADRRGLYLCDRSNVDWGQGLKYLRAALNETDLKKRDLPSYFGTADPILWHPISERGIETIAGHERF